ncbi:MAG: Gfo/Idh/MocA family oxidoreductase [Acidimicrobiales bacterium]
MKQVVQPVGGGPVEVLEVPRPIIGPTEVLVQTRASIISSGTERAVTALAQSSLLGKARARPDLVRQVIAKARTEGVSSTVRAVRSRLGSDIPLGYSASGVVVKVGEAVADIAPGDLVATGGAGAANHAEFQAVPGLLTSPIPNDVDMESAAFATIASIAMHGLRQAAVGPGSKVVVVGLGLVGQLTARLAMASGCGVAGIDVSEHPLGVAEASGVLALSEDGADTTARIRDWSRGRCADAVIITAADKTSRITDRVPELCRDRATVVVVGDVGLDLERTPWYQNELELRFARSYGPGRYERAYEDWGVDHPIGYSRWTEGRNLEAVLDLMAADRLDVSDLVTHRFDLASATDAYDLIESRGEPYLGIALRYDETPTPNEPIVVSARETTTDGVGFIGAGAFASTVLVPAFRAAGADLVAVGSSSGMSARRMADQAGFARAVSGPDGVLGEPNVKTVVIATPHETHAALTARALRAGKNFFCEKPLALTVAEVDDVADALASTDATLFVGFNRRWSPAVTKVAEHFAPGSGPLVVNYRVNAGELPETHWYHDRRQGGRLLGEVCHFVDAAAALVDSTPLAANAVGGGRGESLLRQDLAVTVSFVDGSVAAITYATGGHHSTEKERIEVLGRSRSGVIIDFSEIVLDGKSISIRPQDKGHNAQIAAFMEATRGERQAPDFLAVSRTVIDAAASLVGDE